jgi:hypothetical protein
MSWRQPPLFHASLALCNVSKCHLTHPMLHIVAMPVQLSVFTPGPKYSMIYPVPPCNMLA